MTPEEIEEKWKARLERERKARKESERLLENKSAELYELNLSLAKKVEEELEKNREKELIVFQQSKMAAMGEMIGNIAHQWRQPLSAISSTASSNILQLELGLLSEEEIKKSYYDIINYTNFLSSTIDDFRNFFRNEKEFTHFLIIDSIDKCLGILSGMIVNKSIQVVKKIDNIELFNLKNEFIQVILNIIKNAIDALSNINDTEKRYILINAFEEKTNMILQITDTAGGIPPHIIHKIFEPYFTTKHQSQGTGIGLFMTNEIIVKHMKGSIIVENILTEINSISFMGASFKITIPK
jgi:C4-dicarboxylate-specific signal transduction histidine kinase